MTRRYQAIRRAIHRSWLLFLAVMIIWPCFAFSIPEPASESGKSEPATGGDEQEAEKPSEQSSEEPRTAEERQSEFDSEFEAALAKMDELLLREQKRLAPGSRESTSGISPSLPDDEPRIILYETSWCGYCRKATRLLEQLDADFEARDIEKDRKAAAEFRRKSGGRGGVPLIDVDGELVRGYDEPRIRKLVAELQQEG